MTDEKPTHDQAAEQRKIDDRFWILSDIQRSGEHSYPKVIYFSDEDLRKARYDQDLFEQKILDLISRYPEKIFDVLGHSAGEELFSQAEITEAIKRVL